MPGIRHLMTHAWLAPLAAAALFAMLSAASAPARAADDSALERQMVAAVELDMDEVRSVAAIAREAQAAWRRNCLFHGDGKDHSLTSCARQAQAHPQLAPVLAQHGMSALRFALVISAVLSGQVGADLVASGADHARLEKYGVTTAHLQFVQAHAAEIRSLFEGLELN